MDPQSVASGTVVPLECLCAEPVYLKRFCEDVDLTIEPIFSARVDTFQALIRLAVVPKHKPLTNWGGAGDAVLMHIVAGAETGNEKACQTAPMRPKELLEQVCEQDKWWVGLPDLLSDDALLAVMKTLRFHLKARKLVDEEAEAEKRAAAEMSWLQAVEEMTTKYEAEHHKSVQGAAFNVGQRLLRAKDKKKLTKLIEENEVMHHALEEEGRDVEDMVQRHHMEEETAKGEALLAQEKAAMERRRLDKEHEDERRQDAEDIAALEAKIKQGGRGRSSSEMEGMNSSLSRLKNKTEEEERQRKRKEKEAMLKALEDDKRRKAKEEAETKRRLDEVGNANQSKAVSFT